MRCFVISYATTAFPVEKSNFRLQKKLPFRVSFAAVLLFLWLIAKTSTRSTTPSRRA